MKFGNIKKIIGTKRLNQKQSPPGSKASLESDYRKTISRFITSTQNHHTSIKGLINTYDSKRESIFKNYEQLKEKAANNFATKSKDLDTLYTNQQLNLKNNNQNELAQVDRKFSNDKSKVVNIATNAFSDMNKLSKTLKGAGIDHLVDNLTNLKSSINIPVRSQTPSTCINTMSDMYQTFTSEINTMNQEIQSLIDYRNSKKKIIRCFEFLLLITLIIYAYYLYTNDLLNYQWLMDIIKEIKCYLKENM